MLYAQLFQSSIYLLLSVVRKLVKWLTLCHFELSETVQYNMLIKLSPPPIRRLILLQHLLMVMHRVLEIISHLSIYMWS
jgi:hypothetical protein